MSLVPFLSLIPSASSQAQYPTNSISVGIQITTTSGASDFIVGDSFTYNISLSNIGGKAISSNFNVSVYNPTRETLGTRIYTRTIQPNETAILLPTIVPSVVKGQNESNVFFFDSEGSYKIVITSSSPEYFFRLTNNGRYVYQPTYSYYFDAMPRWEKDWKDQLAQSEQQMENLTQRTLSLSILLYRLTYVIGILTVANIAVMIGHKRLSLGLAAFILGVLAFVFLMNLIGIPWI